MALIRKSCERVRHFFQCSMSQIPNLNATGERIGGTKRKADCDTRGMRTYAAFGETNSTDDFSKTQRRKGMNSKRKVCI
eukprot:scaffold9013_cov121-Alexandrium_tamarense.AAC.2